MLRIHNTLTRDKQPFEPLVPGEVRMYVCGMTVYDYCHLGHARVLVVFDVVYRYLMHRGFRVTYVRNVTDIDDKIIARAAQNGEPMDALTGRFIHAMHEDADALGVLRPTHEPRATGHVDSMLEMIGRLLDNGLAYVADNGDVCYSVKDFPGYGKLSGKQLDDLRAGARVDVAEGKRDPLDFVLWKSAKPGEPSWPSPWGDGRPGWHIECSAMSTECLGDTFDIHGGGMDLQFPHHENEIAQSEGATGHPFVRYWMHNGFVRVNEEKMSKSLGNFFTVREVLSSYSPEEVRFFILASHYRSALNYGDEQLDAARGALTRLYTALRGLPDAAPAAIVEPRARFTAAMDDDFNTPEAIAVLFELAREVNRVREADPASAAALGAAMRELAGVLGLLQGDAEAYLQQGAGEGGMSADRIEALIAGRAEARRARDFARADGIRDELAAAGVTIEDGAQGTTWRRG
ncbi:MAG: cysteine--tRNA ligase [Chromatiales bacterium]|nr:cysteine--tRNA ligase [Chromatiales bacterium]